MSDRQDPLRQDPAGWTQVGLAISAFSVALIAFGEDIAGQTLIFLLSALVSSVVFTYFHAGAYAIGSYKRRGLGIVLLISLSFLIIGVTSWIAHKYL